MAQTQLKAKVNYKPKSSVEVFYSGGAVTLSRNGQLACACQDDIKVSQLIRVLAFANAVFTTAVLNCRSWTLAQGQ